MKKTWIETFALVRRDLVGVKQWDESIFSCYYQRGSLINKQKKKAQFLLTLPCFTYKISLPWFFKLWVRPFERWRQHFFFFLVFGWHSAYCLFHEKMSVPLRRCFFFFFKFCNPKVQTLYIERKYVYFLEHLAKP